MKIKLKKGLKCDANGFVLPGNPLMMLAGAGVMMVVVLIAFLLGMLWDIIGGGLIILAFAVAMQFTPLKGWIGVAAGLIIGVVGLVVLGIL